MKSYLFRKWVVFDLSSNICIVIVLKKECAHIGEISQRDEFPWLFYLQSREVVPNIVSKLYQIK